MNIQILSDLHLEFDDFAIDYAGSDLLVLAGDIHVGDKGVKWTMEHITDIPVIYVLGNHEYYKHAYPKLIGKLKALSSKSNVLVLENESVHFNGVTFHACTLWTDFALFGDPRMAGYECQQRMTDYKKIRRQPNYSKIRPMDVATIHKKSIVWLQKSYPLSKGAANVIITHHAPSVASIPEWHDDNMLIFSAYASNLEPLIEELSPDLWVHGHLHHSSDYTISKTRIVCNPRGYPEERNQAFQHKMVIHVPSKMESRL